VRGRPAARSAGNRQRDPHGPDSLAPARVLFNDAAQAFPRALTLIATPEAANHGDGVAVADFNGDGDLDLLANRGSRHAGPTELLLFDNTVCQAASPPNAKRRP
jgi:hypothetical protein